MMLGIGMRPSTSIDVQSMRSISAVSDTFEYLAKMRTTSARFAP